jgi:hypothetical protein
MGLLDDAIKDHLELKRRHGADPGEVARLEHEALGPARREPVASAEALTDEPLLEDDEAGYEDEVPAQERLEAPIHQLEPEPPAADEPELEAVPEFEPPPAPARSAPPEPEPEAAAPPDPEPDPEAAAPPDPEATSPPEPTVEQPTRQFSLEELEDASQPPRATPRAEPEEEPDEEATRPGHHADDVVPADEEPEADDVLEETPEFLQETPEHDRLWFEQKPPKDFDF